MFFFHDNVLWISDKISKILVVFGQFPYWALFCVELNIPFQTSWRPFPRSSPNVTLVTSSRDIKVSCKLPRMRFSPACVTCQAWTGWFRCGSAPRRRRTSCGQRWNSTAGGQGATRPRPPTTPTGWSGRMTLWAPRWTTTATPSTPASSTPCWSCRPRTCGWRIPSTRTDSDHSCTAPACARMLGREMECTKPSCSFVTRFPFSYAPVGEEWQWLAVRRDSELSAILSATFSTFVKTGMILLCIFLDIWI